MVFIRCKYNNFISKASNYLINNFEYARQKLLLCHGTLVQQDKEHIALLKAEIRFLQTLLKEKLDLTF